MQLDVSSGSFNSVNAHALPLQRVDSERLISPQKPLPEIAKSVQQILRQHVEPSATKEMFEQFICHEATDEITCLEVVQIIKKLEPVSSRCVVRLNFVFLNDKDAVVHNMVKFLLSAETHVIALDQIVTKILFALYEQKVMPVLLIAYRLIHTLNMKFTVPIDSRKVSFVREHLHEIGYKDMRDLLKLVLIEKLDNLPSHVSEFQRLQLIPLEDLMLDLLDRQRNFCPSLFVITEVQRIRQTSNIHMLPRLSRVIREFVVSFRPLAEVNSIICRSWLYPVTNSPIYSWFANSWRLADQTHKIYFKTHLPYGSELLAAQSYFHYVLLKQPRGQTNLHHMVRRTPSQPLTQGQTFKCNEIMQVLILEAMNAMETTNLPIKAEINQYNWRHLFHLVSFALFTNHGDFSVLMENINSLLEMSQFKKGRSELMWMILQYVSISIARLPIRMKIISELFNNLYPDEMCWTGSSDDTWEMTRFFAPASIWIMISKNCEDEQPPLPDKLVRLMQYLEELISREQEHKPTDLALIANSYSNMDKVFQEEVFKPIYKRLSTGNHPSTYHLPYGLETNCMLDCLELNFLEALTFHAKQMLCQNLYLSALTVAQNRRLPSPAIIETITRISLKTEPVGTHMRSSAVVFLNRLLPPPSGQRSEDSNNLILYDLMVYRLKNAILSINNRVNFITCAYEEMPKPNQPVNKNLPLYILMEQVIMRQFMVAPPYDLIAVSCMLAHKSTKVQPRLNIFNSPTEFYDPNGLYSLCPEVSKLLTLHFIMAYKLTADYPNEKSTVTEHINEMNKTHKWPSCSLRWFPQHIKAQQDVVLNFQMFNDFKTEIEVEENQLWSWDGPYKPRQPATFITLFNAMKHKFSPPDHIPRLIKTMPIQNFTDNVNFLVKYVICQARNANHQSDIDRIINSLYELIFVRHYVPFERFFLSLILHPNDDESIKISLIILDSLIRKPDVEKNKGVMKRLESLYKFLPSNAHLLNYNSSDFFKKMFEYRREFGDYDLEKVSAGNEADGDGYSCRVPMYYSNLAERLLPVVDVLFLRCFEGGIDGKVADQFFKAFAPIYRYHPQPITFLYKLTYVLDGTTPAPNENLNRFVTVVCKQLEDDKHSPRYSFLTQEFVVQKHNLPTIKICKVLTGRIVAASTYNHQPPEFVGRDWRIAEFPPASQALVSACVELMVSPKEGRDLVDALIQVSMSKPIKQPFDQLNAAAMLLSNLPERFQRFFFDKVEESFCWSEMRENEPDYLFSSYNVEIMQYNEDRIMSMLALVQAFIQHANVDTLVHLTTAMNTRFAPKVENETQLIYYLRILTVYLMKIIDREKDNSSQYLQLIITIYDMILRILEKQPKLKYEDLICDVLYKFKYTVPGSAVNRETEMAIARFPEGMREKLKYLPSPGMRDNLSRLNANIIHPIFTEIFDHNFKNVLHPSDLPAVDHVQPHGPPSSMNASVLPHMNAPHQTASTISDQSVPPPLQLPHPTNQPVAQSANPQPPPFPYSNSTHQNQQPHSFPQSYGNQQMGHGPPQMMQMPQSLMPHQQPPMSSQSAAFHQQQMPQFSYHPQQMPPPYFMTHNQPPTTGVHGQPQGPHNYNNFNFSNQQQPNFSGPPHQTPMMFNQHGSHITPGMMPTRPPFNQSG